MTPTIAKFQASRPRDAFTTIEVLIVVVILGITAAVAVPMIGNRADIKLAAAARKVIADMQYAQNLSIASRDSVYVRLDADAYSLCRRVSGTLTAITHPIDKRAYGVTLGTTSPSIASLNGVRLVKPSFGGNNVVGFDSLGTPFTYNETTSARTAMTAQGIVQLTWGGLTQNIYIEPYTGEISVP